MSACLRIVTAIELAARWHREEKKKGTEEPYIYHLIEVAGLVSRASDGADPDLAVAAILHDAIEHQDVPPELIQAFFGADVASLVTGMTDDKSVPAAERSALEILAAAGWTERLKLLRFADKISNLRALAARSPADWSVKRRLSYIANARAVVAAMGPVHSGLRELFDTAAAQAEAQLLPAAETE